MPRYYHYLQDRRWLKMSSRNTFSLYRQTSPNFSDISIPSSPPSPPPMASLDQQLQEALTAINDLTEKVQSLTSNLDMLQNENQALRGQCPASAHSSYMPQPTYPSMFSPLQHSPPQPLDSRPLPIPPRVSPTRVSIPSTPPARSFKDLKIASPMPFSRKREDTETFIYSCILYINGCPSEFGTEQNKISWILSHMQTRSAHAWCEYVMAQIFKKTLWYHTADELLQEIQHQFGDTDKRATMSLKIRTMMQGDRTAEKHVQDFKKAALEAGYKGFPLIVEFKWSIHPALQKWLSEIRPQPVSIQEWYNEAITIDWQWKIMKAEEAFYGKANQVVLRGNPSRHRQERCWSGMPLDNHIIHMDKEATKIGANHQLDWRWHPVRTTDRDKKIPMQWTSIGHRSADLL